MAGGPKTPSGGAKPSSPAPASSSGVNSSSSSKGYSDSPVLNGKGNTSTSPYNSPTKAAKKWQNARAMASATPRPAWNSSPVNKPVTPRTPTSVDPEGGTREGGSPSSSASVSTLRVSRRLTTMPTPPSTEGSALFKLGAAMVLDQEKQDKLASLIKAVQCVFAPPPSTPLEAGGGPSPPTKTRGEPQSHRSIFSVTSSFSSFLINHQLPLFVFLL